MSKQEHGEWTVSGRSRHGFRVTPLADEIWPLPGGAAELANYAHPCAWLMQCGHAQWDFCSADFKRSAPKVLFGKILLLPHSRIGVGWLHDRVFTEGERSWCKNICINSCWHSWFARMCDLFVHEVQRVAWFLAFFNVRLLVCSRPHQMSRRQISPLMENHASCCLDCARLIVSWLF